MLQDVDWCLSIEKEGAFIEQFSLSLHLVLLLVQKLHLRCLLELFGYLILLGSGCCTGADGKLFAGDFLQFLYLHCVKVHAVAVLHALIVLRRVLLAQVSEKFEVDEL